MKDSSHANVLNRKSNTLMAAYTFSVFLVFAAEVVKYCGLLFREEGTNAEHEWKNCIQRNCDWKNQRNF